MLGAKVLWIPCKGEVRSLWTASLSTTPAYKLTDCTFTGQFSYMDDPSTTGATEGFGLMFYNACWYDPALGRFAQADTVIPQHQGVQAWDRYAYTNNNPVRYTDPSGHCIGLMTCSLTALGYLPDIQGIANVVLWTNTKDATIAAGLAVQSQWGLSMITGSGLGFAGATESDLEGRNPFSVSVAEEVIYERIDRAQKSCDAKCGDGADLLIVAAIAQNGYDLDFSSLPLDPSDGTINWHELFDSNFGGNTEDPFASPRQEITNMDYSAEFMLKLYMQDLQILIDLGYDLPEWVTEEDVQCVKDTFLQDKFVAPKDKK